MAVPTEGRDIIAARITIIDPLSRRRLIPRAFFTPPRLGHGGFFVGQRIASDRVVGEIVQDAVVGAVLFVDLEDAGVLGRKIRAGSPGRKRPV